MPLILRALGAAAFLACTAAQAVVPLPVLNIDTTQITVSGLSAGGFMANQLGYAYPSTFKGVGVFAGGPRPRSLRSNSARTRPRPTHFSSANRQC